MQQKRAGVTQQSSLKTMARRVLVLAATAAALRPTLPRRTRTPMRAALTMHDYDYDARQPRPFYAIDWRRACANLTRSPRHQRATIHAMTHITRR